MQCICDVWTTTVSQNSFDLASEKDEDGSAQIVWVGNREMHVREHTHNADVTLLGIREIHVREHTHNAYFTLHPPERKRSLAPAGKRIRLAKH